MFRLPTIGVSACVRTGIGHATSTPLHARGRLRPTQGGALAAAARQRTFSSAAFAPLGLSRQAFRSLITQHDSARSAVSLQCLRLGPRPATHEGVPGSRRPALCREIDASLQQRRSAPFSFDGAKSQVPEVLHP
tara:strand:- start:734 stop:1135 length:402 start_codon:yes stop_codon:yes gene_type:complete